MINIIITLKNKKSIPILNYFLNISILHYSLLIIDISIIKLLVMLTNIYFYFLLCSIKGFLQVNNNNTMKGIFDLKFY